MRVSFEHPPNWDEILAAFPLAKKRGVFFCYGDTIYSPSGVMPTPDIFAHEAVHQRQQGDDPEEWWYHYIENPRFRLDMEIEAYRAQLAFIAATHGRTEKRKAIRGIAAALSSPLYGSLLNKTAAMERLA